MLLDMLVFAVMAMFYKYVVISGESEGNGNVNGNTNGNGIPMQSKHGSINASFVEDNGEMKR